MANESTSLKGQTRSWQKKKKKKKKTEQQALVDFVWMTPACTQLCLRMSYDHSEKL